jgi:hypothetical protein
VIVTEQGKNYIKITTTELVANGQTNENRTYNFEVVDLSKVEREIDKLLTKLE